MLPRFFTCDFFHSLFNFHFCRFTATPLVSESKSSPVYQRRESSFRSPTPKLKYLVDGRPACVADGLRRSEKDIFPFLLPRPPPFVLFSSFPDLRRPPATQANGRHVTVVLICLMYVTNWLGLLVEEGIASAPLITEARAKAFHCTPHS